MDGVVDFGDHFGEDLDVLTHVVHHHHHEGVFIAVLLKVDTSALVMEAGGKADSLDFVFCSRGRMIDVHLGDIIGMHVGRRVGGLA